MKQRTVSLLIGLIATVTSAQITPGSFGPAVILPAGDSPVQCALVDLENDDKPDLVVINHLNSILAVYRNQSARGTITPGSFAAPINLPSGPRPHAMTVEDVDGDGRLDVVICNLANHTISIFRNTSASNVISFAPRLDVPIGALLPRDVAVGDLDADGRSDIAVCAHDSDSLVLLRNIGAPAAPQFDPPFIIANIGDGPHAVAIKDLDRDGRLDLIVGNFQAPDLVVIRRSLHANPSRPFSPDDFAPPLRFPRGGNALDVADIDGDSRLDIAIGNWRTHRMAIYRNTSPTGAISFDTPVELDTGNSVHHVAINDVDGDAKPELVLVGELASYMSIYRNLSTPGSLTSTSFAPRVQFPSGWNAVGVTVGDIDDDGRPDIVFANAYDDNLSVYRNRLGDTNVLSPPVFVQQPQSQTVELGGTAIFQVGVTGSPPFGFRWRQNGLTIVPFGVGTDTLVISNAQTSHAGTYDVIVTNAANPKPGVISDRVTLTVLTGTNLPPTITRHPQSQTVASGADVTFSVEATGTEPLGYRWRRNGIFLPGATNPVLTLSSVTISNAGFYSVIVSNIAGIRSSSNAQLQVVTPTNPPPPTLRLVDATSRWRYEQTGSDLGTTWIAPSYDDTAWPEGLGLLGVETAPLPAPIYTPLTLGPVTFYFRHSFDLQGQYLSTQSVFRAHLIVDDGAVVYVNGVEALRLGMPAGPITPDTLATRTVGDAVFEGPFTIPTGLFVAGLNVIAVEVHQSFIASSDIVFGMTLDLEPGPGIPVPPRITRQPQTQTVAPGGTATFSVEATGTPPLSYQWHKNTAIIAGAADRILTLSNVSSNDAGFYSVLVSNTAGSVMSTQALLRVVTPVPTALPPMITSFTPLNGPTGTVVTISGMNFSANPIANRVYFGAVRARVVDGSSNVLAAEVPVGTTYAPISVITSNRIAYSDKPFVVTFPSSRTIHSGSFSGFKLGAGDLPIHVSLGDMNGDGKVDLLVVNVYSSTIGVYINQSTSFGLEAANFAPPRVYATGPTPYYMALADMDADGALDVITANRGNHTISIFRNTPADFFALAPPLHFPVGQLPTALATADLDKDGRTDIIVGNHDSDSITILRQISNPFSSLTVVPFTRTDIRVGDGPHNVLAGDIDGDGRSEIVVANYQTPTMAILRNLTAGPGITASSFALPVHFPRGGNCMAFGDLDGDGKSDIAIGNWRTRTLSLFHNTAFPGTITLGSLAAPVDFAMGNNPHTIAFSDLDGDAGPDIVVVGELNSYMSVFKNLSSPGMLHHSSFGPRVDFASGWNAVGVAAGDLDGDSRPDLVFANAYDDNLTIYHNQTIIPPNAPPVARATASPAVDFLSEGSTFVIIAPLHGHALVVFDGAASSDPDGDPLTYAWSANGAVFASGAVRSNLLAIGAYSIALTVSDGLATDIANITVEVIDAASAVEALIVIIEQSNLPRRSKRPIIASLKAAALALAQDRTVGLNQLQSTQAKIERQIAPDDPALAALLNDAIQQIIDALSAAP